MKTHRAIAALLFAGIVAAQEPAAPPSEISAIVTPAEELTGEGQRSAEGGERDEIETDRDSFTPAVRTVGKRRLVLESGYSFFDNRHRAETHSFPEFIARYGITERIELRLGWNYEASGTEHGDLERETNLNIGAKALINEQRHWLPESSIILATLVPTSGPESQPLFVGTYVFGWDLPNHWKLDAAMRYGTDVEEHDHFADWAPSVVVKAPIGEKINVHAEYFGLFTSGKEHDDVRQYVSPGIHYLITPDLEVGLRLGWGLNDQSARFFSNVGVGYRF